MRMRRSLLFVPGEARKIDKARSAGADTLILDLEDSIPPERKAEARAQVAAALRAGGFDDTEIAVRVNPRGTPFFRQDLDAVLGAGVATIMLPKVDGREIRFVTEFVDGLERSLGMFGDSRVRFLALVETALGVRQAESVGFASRVDALCFGHADFALDMGLAEADASCGVVYHARCSLVIAAKACGVVPIDSVCLAVKDEQVVRADAELGMRLGFEGKLCIHPQQVRIVNEVYTPDEKQIEYARRVVDAWEGAKQDERGVLTLDGKMIDAPLVAAQQRVLDRARRAGPPRAG
jgi:citrate lyase beta subunit